MRRHALLVCLALFALPLLAAAQGPLLIDPARVPVTLKGGWIHPHPQIGQSQLALKIETMQPDGSFTGKLDFLSNQATGACRAVNQPIKEGKVTDRMLRVVAYGGAPNVCGNLYLVFHPGSKHFLEGRVKTDTSGGAPMWLDAPK